MCDGCINLNSFLFNFVHFFVVVVIRKISCDLPIKHRKQNDINNFRRQMERDHIYYIRWHGHHRYRHWNLFAFWNVLLFLKWENWFGKNGISFFLSSLHQSHRECEHFIYEQNKNNGNQHCLNEMESTHITWSEKVDANEMLSRALVHKSNITTKSH